MNFFQQIQITTKEKEFLLDKFSDLLFSEYDENKNLHMRNLVHAFVTKVVNSDS